MSNLVALIQDWDGHFVEEMAHRRTVSLNRLMVLMTRLGDGWAWVALGLAVLFFDSRHSAQVLFPLGIGLLLDIPLYIALKHKFSRPRPFQYCDAVSCITEPPDRFSFPSGHTSVAIVVFVIAGTFYSWLFVPLAALAALIGASRVYLGVHYPTDVLAGAVLGLLCGNIALWLG